MTHLYHRGSRTLQDRFDTRRLADRIEERLVHTRLSAHDRDFIEACDMFFLATADAEGRPNCSYKGGDPGFVRALDAETLAFPSYDGNGMFLSLGNMIENPHVGLLFIDFAEGGRLRVNGEVSLAGEADPLLSEFVGAKVVVRLHIREIFPNCPRYIHRMKLEARSDYVPNPSHAAPIPGWKRASWASDVLPHDDPAREPTD